MGKSSEAPKGARPRRSRGEGAIIETADGRLRGRIVLPHPDGDRTVTRWVSGRTRAEIVRKFDALRRDATAGELATETTGAYLARWLIAVTPTLRPATVAGYRNSVERHLAPLAKVPLAKLTPAHVERLTAGMIADGLQPLTAHHVRATLRKALALAQRDGLVNRNVAALATPPKVERREMKALTAAEVGRLLAATADHPFGPLFATAIGTGLRLGELVALRWTDIDLEARRLVVRRSMALQADRTYGLAEPKTARSRRTVELAAVAFEALRRQKARQASAKLAAGTAWQDRDGLAFTDPVGRPFTPSRPSFEFHKVAARLGLAVRFHDLRHTYASLLLAAGVPMKVVSEALGHSSIVITADTYAHVTPELRREAADAMDRALSGGAS